jgi:hypothetical protein
MVRATGVNPYLSVLSRELCVRSEASDSLLLMVRREAVMPGEIRALNQSARHEGAYQQIARRFGDFRIPDARVTRQIVDPLAAVVAQAHRTWYFGSVVNAGLLTDHPIDAVMAAIVAMTKDGAKPVVSTGKFIDAAARAYAAHLGIGGNGGGGKKKSLEGEPFPDTLARMHEIAAKCEHGLIRWQ